MPRVYQSWMLSKPNLKSWLPPLSARKYVNCALTWGFLRSLVKAFHPDPAIDPLPRNCNGGFTAGSTAGTIGQPRWNSPTFTLRKVLSLSSDCHSPLPIHETLFCASTESGGFSVERLRYGFCFCPRW